MKKLSEKEIQEMLEQKLPVEQEDKDSRLYQEVFQALSQDSDEYELPPEFAFSVAQQAVQQAPSYRWLWIVGSIAVLSTFGVLLALFVMFFGEVGVKYFTYTAFGSLLILLIQWVDSKFISTRMSHSSI